MHTPHLTDDSECAVMIKGAIIDKYLIRQSMSQGEVKFLNSKRYLQENQGAKSQHHKNDRIVLQAITGVNERIRLKMTLIEKGIFCANSVNYLVFKNNAVNTKYILALLGRVDICGIIVICPHSPYLIHNGQK